MNFLESEIRALALVDIKSTNGFPSTFKRTCFSFFDKYYRDDDRINEFFQELNGLCITINCGYSVLFFHNVINICEEWENKYPDKLIHKGTPYYFYGMMNILRGDLEKGIMLMHQAYKEDLKLNLPEASKKDLPAHLFISLSDKTENHLFGQYVREVINFLEEKIVLYNDRHTRWINLDTIRGKFFENAAYEDERFYFVYCIFRLHKLEMEIEKSIKKNAAASYIYSSYIFDLCSFIESFLKAFYADYTFHNKKGEIIKNPNFRMYIAKLCQESNEGLTLDSDKMGRANTLVKSDFETTLTALLEDNLKDPEYVSTPKLIENDLTLTYCIRNQTGHDVHSRGFYFENSSKIVQAILNSIFFLIEIKL